MTVRQTTAQYLVNPQNTENVNKLYIVPLVESYACIVTLRPNPGPAMFQSSKFGYSWHVRRQSVCVVTAVVPVCTVSNSQDACGTSVGSEALPTELMVAPLAYQQSVTKLISK